MSITNDIDNLQTLTVPELAAEYERLVGARPRTRHRAWLLKRCAFQIQLRACGGLSRVAQQRLCELMADISLPTPASPRESKAAPGTALQREWHGKQVLVHVLADGRFEWNGTTYRSLSAVARAITGQHWNGRLFFGLTGRRPA